MSEDDGGIINGWKLDVIEIRGVKALSGALRVYFYARLHVTLTLVDVALDNT